MWRSVAVGRRAQWSREKDSWAEQSRLTLSRMLLHLKLHTVALLHILFHVKYSWA